MCWAVTGKVAEELMILIQFDTHCHVMINNARPDRNKRSTVRAPWKGLFMVKGGSLRADLPERCPSGNARINYTKCESHSMQHWLSMNCLLLKLNKRRPQEHELHMLRQQKEQQKAQLSCSLSLEPMSAERSKRQFIDNQIFLASISLCSFNIRLCA